MSDRAPAAGGVGVRPELPPLGEGEFALFQALVREQAGIQLTDAKRALFLGRVGKRVRELQVRSFRAYHEVVRSEPEELRLLLDLLCTHETSFFREPFHFAFLEEQLFPRWEREAELGLRPRHLRAWSAACSTGEEPFSLAMALCARFPAERGWTVEVLASDLSRRALATAEQATWPLGRASTIPPDHLRRFMLRGTGSQLGRMRAGMELRGRIRFQRLNLVEAPFPSLGRFELLFCRNVLMYFEPAVKRRVVRGLMEHLAPDGHLFVGHAESLVGIPVEVTAVRPTIYARAGRTAAPTGPAGAPR